MEFMMTQSVGLEAHIRILPTLDGQSVQSSVTRHPMHSASHLSPLNIKFKTNRYFLSLLQQQADVSLPQLSP